MLDYINLDSKLFIHEQILFTAEYSNDRKQKFVSTEMYLTILKQMKKIDSFDLHLEVVRFEEQENNEQLSMTVCPVEKNCFDFIEDTLIECREIAFQYLIQGQQISSGNHDLHAYKIFERVCHSSDGVEFEYYAETSFDKSMTFFSADAAENYIHACIDRRNEKELIFESIGCDIKRDAECISIDVKKNSEDDLEFVLTAKFPAVMAPDSTKVFFSDIDFQVDKTIFKGVYVA